MTRHIYEWNALDAWMIKITRGGPSFSSEYATYRPRDQGQADPRRFSSGSRQLSEPNLARKPRIDPPKQLSKSLQPSKAASPVLAPVVAKAFLLEPEARLALPPARTTRSVRSAQDLRSTAQLVNHPGGAMFNAKMLSELLAKNQHKDLYPRLFVMSPNGTLLAYSTPANIMELRDQAALVSLAWTDYQGQAEKRKQPQDSAQSSQSSGSTIAPGSLETMTIEAEHCNILVRAVQPRMLLVLIGNIPPHKKRPFRITMESPGDARYPSAELSTSVDTLVPSPGPNPSSSSSPDSAPASGVVTSSAQSATSKSPKELTPRQKDIKLGVLHIQRKKLDVLTEYIREDLDSQGFVMPDIL